MQNKMYNIEDNKIFMGLKTFPATVKGAFISFEAPLPLLRIKALSHTVRKMGLILRSIERMLKMQFSIARKFTLQLLRIYDIKPPEKTAQA
jgi:hypothetical protein